MEQIVKVLSGGVLQGWGKNLLSFDLLGANLHVL